VPGTVANGYSSTASSTYSTANGSFSTAIGVNAKSAATNSIAIGSYSYVPVAATNAIAVGNNASATATNASAWGANSTNTTPNSIKFGYEGFPGYQVMTPGTFVATNGFVDATGVGFTGNGGGLTNVNGAGTFIDLYGTNTYINAGLTITNLSLIQGGSGFTYSQIAGLITNASAGTFSISVTVGPLSATGATIGEFNAYIYTNGVSSGPPVVMGYLDTAQRGAFGSRILTLPANMQIKITLQTSTAVGFSTNNEVSILRVF
jgi:hypothetical protein